MVKLFYSYSHKDERFRDDMEKHLAVLKDEGLISEWHDRRIVPGQMIHSEIDKHLGEADVVLLLLSPDFLASRECQKEKGKALEIRQQRSAVVVPVILREPRSAQSSAATIWRSGS